jgi:hypothetical protein
MNKVNCANCGKEVDEDDTDRYGDCRACVAQDRASDMCVGDIKDK